MEQMPIVISFLVLAIVGFVLGVNKTESVKHKQIYEKMDDGYVKKDVCAVTHENVNRRLKSIEDKIDKLLLRGGT